MEEEPAPPSAAKEPDGKWNLILVNSTNALPDGFDVELATVSDGYRVDARIADNLSRMFLQAKEDGINLIICSAYRTPEKQQENFNNQVQQYLDQGDTAEEADAKTVAYIARPGFSEHHTGLAVDIVTPEYQTLNEGFANTPAFRWLDEHAHKYGFILRYPKSKEGITQISYEPWHYRYVGEEHAAAIKQSGDCLEEYLAALQNANSRGAGTGEPDPTDSGADVE